MAVNFQAFIDESYSKEEFVLAGHIAPAEEWAKFAKGWEELLPFGVRLENGDQYHFKMSQMALTEERMARVPAFYRLIEQHVVSSISCRINLVDLQRAHDRIGVMARRMNWTINWNAWANPYFLTFRLLLDNFHQQRQKFESKIPLDEKVDFIFDENTEKKPILEAWDEYLSIQEDDVRIFYGATPRFEDDKEFLPLQGADLWAWWVREWYEEDSHPTPDKMLNYDFGSWKGKKRPNIAISADEDQLVALLESIAVSEIAAGNYFQDTP